MENLREKLIPFTQNVFVSIVCCDSLSSDGHVHAVELKFPEELVTHAMCFLVVDENTDFRILMASFNKFKYFLR